jgi:hypothetical protein
MVEDQGRRDLRRRWWIAGVGLLLAAGGVVLWTVWRAEVALEGARPAEGRGRWVPVEPVRVAGADVWWAAEYVDAVVWEGSVWAASTSAVVEYGSNREVRRVLRAGAELPGAVVTSLAVGGTEGTLWIGTRGGGLVEYDGKRVRQWAERGEAGRGDGATGWGPRHATRGDDVGGDGGRAVADRGSGGAGAS